MPTINFSKFFFNPNFYWAMKVLNDPKLRYGFFYGGSSSGKTYSIVQAVLISTLMDSKNSIIFRKIGSTIRRSIYNDFVQVIKSMHLEQFFEIQMLNIKCSNGSHIAFTGIDDSEKIKGLSSYKRIVVDEITELEPEDFQQLRKRMRGIENQTMLATFNPIDENHWLKKDLMDNLNLNVMPSKINKNPLTNVTEVQCADNYIFIKSTYMNNFWVVGSPDGTFGYKDSHTIADFERDKQLDINFYNIYALGHWGKLISGTEFYKSFKRINHVTELEIDEELPLHISIDENVRPYLPLIVMQTEDKFISVVDEICGKSPNNNVNDVIKIFANKYGNWKNRKIFIYGDATSRRHDARTENGYSLFGIMVQQLEQHGFTDITVRVPNANPSVAQSGRFMNMVLSGLTPYTLQINESCHNTITDFQYLKEDKDGGILKERARDKVSNTSFERYGHCSDCIRYFVTKYLESDYQNSIGRKSKFESYDIPLDDNILAF